MRAVIGPGAAHQHPLTAENAGGMADDGDQVPLSTRLHAQHAEPTLLVVVGDTLHQASQRFGRSGVGGLWIRSGWHAPDCTGAARSKRRTPPTRRTHY